MWILVAAQLVGCAAAPAPPAPPVAPPAPVTANGTTVVAVQPPAAQCCPHPTIWEVLGFKALCTGVKGLFGRLLSRLGMFFPGLEPKPELLPITDPANLESENPAVKAAAEVKGEEDGAEQKVKAIRYLGTIGCGGCYPDVQDALLAALDDCTEEVRYEAVKALREQSGNPCARCKSTACCSEKVRKRLDKVVNGRDKQNCYLESSPRVRRLARLTLAGCGPAATTATQSPNPLEGPTAAHRSPMRVAKIAQERVAKEEAAGLRGPTGAKTATGVEPAAAEELLYGDGIEPTPVTPDPTSPFNVAPKAAPPTRIEIKMPPRPRCNCGAMHEPNCPERDSLASHEQPLNSASTRNQVILAGGIEPATSDSPATTVDASTPGVLGSIPDAKPIQSSANTQPIDPANDPVLAKVNGESVYASEVEPLVERELARAGNLPADLREQLRQATLEHALQKVIDHKLVSQEARRRETGSGVEQVAYIEGASPTASERERNAAWLRRAAPVDETVTFAELQEHYNAHREAFTGPAKARGEVLTASPAQFRSTEEAREVIAHLRDRALGRNGTPPRGANLRAVKVEQLDWRSRSEIASPLIAQALFTLPVGTVSGVVEDAGGYHVIHVLERRGGEPAALEVVADDVRRAVVAERRRQAEQVYISQLRATAEVFRASR